MRLPKFINKLSLLVNVFKYKGISGIHSRKEFYRIIERERERAGRNNHQVSMIVFNLELFPDNSQESRQLVKNIIKEKRSIDEIGWYDKTRVGVILPYTSSHGARNFSVRLSRTLNFIMPDSFCYLFTYPLEDRNDAEPEDKVNDEVGNSVAAIKNTAADYFENKPDDFVQNSSVRSISR
jgi:hypothetical protein